MGESHIFYFILVASSMDCIITHLYITACLAMPTYGIKKVSHRKCIINHDLSTIHEYHSCIIL